MSLVATRLGGIFVDDRGYARERTALLWPSLFTDHCMWDAQVSMLQERGWRTLALDPPGHGASPGVDREFTMDECAEAAFEVLDALAVTGPVVVLGTSWGGFVAPRMALLRPDRIRALGLFSTSADAPFPVERVKSEILATVMRSSFLDPVAERLRASSLFSRSTRDRHPEVVRSLAERLRGWDRTRVLHAVRSVLLRREGLVDRLGSVRCPAVVASVSEDAIFPPRLGRRIAGAIPRASFEQITGASHLLPLEAPRAVNGLISRLLSGLP